MAGAMGYALPAGAPGKAPAQNDALLVIAVAAVAMTVGALPHIAAGRPAGLTAMSTRLVAVACVAFIFRPLVSRTMRGIGDPWGIVLPIMRAAGGARLAGGDAGRRADPGRRRWGRGSPSPCGDEMRLQWALGLARRRVGHHHGFSAKEMGLTELAVFIGPLLVTQIAFRRYAGIRATYLQTVRSLARVTEVAATSRPATPAG